MKKIIFLLPLIFWSIIGLSQAPFADFDNYIQKGMQQWKIPGMAVAFVKEGKVIYAKGYGVREMNKMGAVDEHTIFGIGSNTKAFTALGLAMLEFEGKLSLNHKITRYYPDFQLQDTFASRDLTIRDLLCHRIGVDTWNGDFTHWGSRYSKKELIYKMRFIPTAFPLRAGYGYCNVGYMLAGEMIPLVTNGMSWERYMQEKILSPLGMRRTCVSTNDLPNFENVATPHTLYRNSLATLPWRNIDNLAACGSINSSVIDMSKWLIMQMDSGRFEGSRIVPWKALLQTQSPQFVFPRPPYGNAVFPSTHFNAYGLGWFMKDYQGNILINHSGAVDGMVSQTAFLPEKKIGIVILTNSDAHNFITPLMYQMVDAALGAKSNDWNTFFWEQAQAEKEETEIVENTDDNVNPPMLKPDAYAGYYIHPHYGQMTIRYQNNELVIYPSAHPRTTGKLKHQNSENFLIEWTDKMWDRSKCNFQLDEDGKTVQSFTLTTRPDLLDPMEYEFVRMGDGSGK